MKIPAFGSLLILLGAGLLATPAAAQVSFAFSDAQSCLVSNESFQSNNEPQTGAFVYHVNFHGIGTGSVVSATPPSTFSLTQYDNSIVIPSAYTESHGGGHTYAQSVTTNISGSTAAINSGPFSGIGAVALTASSFSGTVTSGPDNGASLSVTPAGVLILLPSTYGSVIAGPFASVSNLTPVATTFTIGSSTLYQICGLIESQVSPK